MGGRFRMGVWLFKVYYLFNSPLNYERAEIILQSTRLPPCDSA